MTAFIALNFKTFESLSVVIVVSGTVGGAASNYRRLQEAYVQQLGKFKPEPEITLQINSERSVDKAPEIPEEDSVIENLETPLSEAERSPKLPIDDKATLLLLRLQIFLSPLFGGLFAFVLYGVFASGIIQGEIFPKFKSSEEEYTTPYEFVDKTVPETNSDMAKAILWAFIAGFAEGFVPNFIDKLVKEAEQDRD
ncbi:MAG: hypothetical protein F6K42_18770 [Leptolyngbya sp. SIO1D8]|nr:hypothetical protein [Leptolyngbya sp. SIO1D8]